MIVIDSKPEIEMHCQSMEGDKWPNSKNIES